ncbi:MAG: FixH family protein [Pseudohongiella sp.]|nr:FixH family protein [Pseudohongiella sp.]MDO9522050.1 FixH family protein [Pseudohongiella sp.]MDP2128685.1 FixH family protein [Pseudohongiella sp.]
MNSQQDTKPWYQHRWPWILISMPAVSVVLGIILISTALNNPAILVVDNYYAEGRGINRSLALDEAAINLGLSARLAVQDNTINLQLLGTDAPHQNEEALSLFVYHVTDNTLDQTFVFAPDADPVLSAQGFYEPVSSLDVTALQTLFAQNTSWYLEIRGVDNDWRLRKRVSTPQREVSF